MAEQNPLVILGTVASPTALTQLKVGDTLAGVVNHLDFAANQIPFADDLGAFGYLTVAANTLVGNTGAGLGPLTVGEVQTMLSLPNANYDFGNEALTGVFADGEILYRSGGQWINQDFDALVTVASTPDLDSLTNVTLTTVADDDLLVRAGTGWVNQPIDNLVTVPATLDDLDVDLTTPAVDEFLVLNGSSRWENKSLASLITDTATGLTALDDVTLAGSGANEVLAFNGTAWVNTDLSTLPTGASAIGGLSDVTLGVLGATDVLTHNGTAWVNQDIGTLVTLPATLDDLNVTLSAVADNQILLRSGTDWVNSTLNAAITATTSVGDLSDVTVGALGATDVLTHNGTAWVNTDVTTLVSVPTVLDDLNVTLGGGLADNDLLIRFGTDWVNSTVGDLLTGTATGITALADVDLGVLAANEVLAYDGAEWKNTDLTTLITVPTTAGSLTDVTLDGTLTDDHVLVRDGGFWVNKALATVTNVPTMLSDLNVDIVGALDNDLLIRSGTGWDTLSLAALIAATTTGLNALDDVTPGVLTSGEVLHWNGTAWVNTDPNTLVTLPTTLDDLNVTLTSVGDDEFLIRSGAAWVNTTLDELFTSLGTGLNALTDVTLGALATDEVLHWTGATWANTPLNALVTVPTTLDDLNVSLSGVAVNQVLTRTAANTGWENKSLDVLIGETTNLTDLADVAVGAIGANNVLHNPGSGWVNEDITNIISVPTTAGTLDDVTLDGTLTDDHVLVRDGAFWVNKALATVTNVPTLLSDLNVDIVGAADDHVLVRSGAAWDTKALSTLITDTTTELDALTDTVFATAPAVGEVLHHNGTNWVNTLLSGLITLPTTLDDLNVTLTTVGNNDLLIRSGSDWVNTDLAALITATATGLGALDGVTLASEAAGEVLHWNGSAWVNTDPNTLVTVPAALNDLTDAVITGTPGAGEVLYHDGSTFANRTIGLAEMDDVADSLSPAAEQVLTFTTGEWLASTPKQPVVQAEVTADMTPVAFDVIPVNTTSGPITITAPTSPNTGDFFTVSDSRKLASTNNIIVDFTAGLLHTASVTDVLDRDGIAATYYYVDATVGWIADYSIPPTVAAATTFTATVTDTEWGTAAGGIYTASIPVGTHGLGTDVTADTWDTETVAGSRIPWEGDVQIDVLGNITISCQEVPDARVDLLVIVRTY